MLPFSFKVEELADKLQADRLSYRRAFGTHLQTIAKAINAIERVESRDMEEGSDRDIISECINPSLMFSTLIAEAVKIRDELTVILNGFKK